MADHQETQFNDQESPFLISHFVHTLRAYRALIVLGVIAVAIVYFIAALLLYLRAPARRITTQAFRLQFEGANSGTYPNGVKFSSAEIVASPVLLKVFQDNQLGQFTTFADFSRSMFILESNPEYERLAAEYQARLADPRLSAVDRERVENEWESKRTSLNKSDYSVNYVRADQQGIPESVIRKTLSDVLITWAAYAKNERHLTEYRIAMLSPEFLSNGLHGMDDPVTTILLLRSKIVAILNEIDELLTVPGAELIRTKEGLSLAEIWARSDELLRFRVEPLIGLTHSSGIIRNPAATIQYLETQLAYDQRRLKLLQDQADAVKQAMAVYTLSESARASLGTSEGNPAGGKTQAGTSSETVMPQLSDTFIDRLVALTNQSGDIQYRQKLVNDYRKAMAFVIPAQQEVTYDQQMLNTMRGGVTASAGITADDVRARITATQNEARQLVMSVNEIYQIVSRNLNPATELYAITAPPVTRLERAVSTKSLLLYGVVIILAAFAVVAGLCLLHNRIREEEAEQYQESARDGTAPRAIG